MPKAVFYHRLNVKGGCDVKLNVNGRRAINGKRSISAVLFTLNANGSCAIKDER